MRKQRTLRCFSIVIITGTMVVLSQMIVMSPQPVINNFKLSPLEFDTRVSVQPETKPKRRGASKVIILTYMRSGSSLTGDILQQSPGAFYVYEPIHNIRWHDRTENWTYPGAPTKLVTPETIYNERVDVLYRLLTCDLMNVPDRVLQDGFLGRGFLTGKLQPCVNAAKNKHNQTHGTKACILDLQRACQASPLRVLKTIRVSMEQGRNLSVLLPDLKIIHLLRDPRPTLSSHVSLGQCSGFGKQKCAERFCAMIEDDVVKADSMSNSNRNGIFTLRYEDLARNPIQVSKTLYEYVAGSFTKEVEDYVFNITSAGRNDDCAICTTRENSSKLIEKWKTTMNTDFVRIIQNRCNYLLKRFGYAIMPL